MVYSGRQDQQQTHSSRGVAMAVVLITHGGLLGRNLFCFLRNDDCRGGVKKGETIPLDFILLLLCTFFHCFAGLDSEKSNIP